ncbi:MAG: hypothetical protein P8Y71_09525 [Pseudolabrys sp.]|jgi:hypothetical protein
MAIRRARKKAQHDGLFSDTRKKKLLGAKKAGQRLGVGHRSRAQHHLKINDRSSRFFRCREKYGSPPEFLAMGDLSRRQE